MIHRRDETVSGSGSGDLQVMYHKLFRGSIVHTQHKQARIILSFVFDIEPNKERLLTKWATGICREFLCDAATRQGADHEHSMAKDAAPIRTYDRRYVHRWLQRVESMDSGDTTCSGRRGLWALWVTLEVPGCFPQPQRGVADGSPRNACENPVLPEFE